MVGCGGVENTILFNDFIKNHANSHQALGHHFFATPVALSHVLARKLCISIQPDISETSEYNFLNQFSESLNLLKLISDSQCKQFPTQPDHSCGNLVMECCVEG